MKAFKAAISVSLLMFAGCSTSPNGSTREHRTATPLPASVTSARAVEGTGQTKAGNFVCVLQPVADGLYLTELVTEKSRCIPWDSCFALQRWGDVLLVRFSKNAAPDFEDWRTRSGELGFSFRSEDKPGLDYLAQWFARYLPNHETKEKTRSGED